MHDTPTTTRSRGPRSIRLARVDDAEALREIYAPYCLSTPITFEIEAPSVEEMRSRLSSTLDSLPWLVCADGPDVVGYAYAAPFRARAAYRWSVELTVYVREGSHGQGIGGALYGTLLALVDLQGYWNAYAGITLPNPASVRLQERFGFELVGVYNRVGYKLGGWHDVGTWSRRLREDASEPVPPRPIAEAMTRPGWSAALADGVRALAPKVAESST